MPVTRILPCAAALALLACLADAVAQPAQKPLAQVTVTGKESGAVSIDIDGKKDRFVLIDLDGRTILKVRSKQDITKFNESLMADHDKLTEEYTAQAKKLIAQNDLKGLEKLEKDLTAASQELLKYISFVGADGALAQENGELRMNGTVRLFDYKGADKALGKGKALVVGEATQVKHDSGKGERPTLAIQNGDHPIVIIGKAAETQVDAKGTLRVVGVLRAGKGGQPIVEAEKVEVLKK